MKGLLVALGVACFVAAACVAAWLQYQAWFVHPEYTERMLLLTYWRTVLFLVGLFIAGAVGVQGGKL